MERRRRAIVPLTLGLGMLAVVIAAGLSPNAGVVRASSNCTYGQCVASQPFPVWAVASSIAAVVIALLVALLLLRRRRRPGQPPAEWQGSGGGGGAPPGSTGPEEAVPYGAAGAVAGVEPEVTPESMGPPAWHEGTTEVPGEGPEGGAPSEVGPSGSPPPPEYLETPSAPEPASTPAPVPEPAPLAPSVPGPSPAAAGAPAAQEPSTEEAEPDIDSLMAELEKISGEILKQKPRKKNGPPSPPSSNGDSA